MSKTILVLEGGAMRSLFTSAALDVFMENNIEFDALIGVSAGALTGSNYISKQIGRTAKINIEYCDDKNYIGLKAIKTDKGLVGFNYLFNEISENKEPFDEKTFNENKRTKFIVGATNCNTGKTEYFIKKNQNWKSFSKIVQASSSMPLVSKSVKIGKDEYLDGAIECNIPIDWALENGFDKIVVVLTRQKDYNKKQVSNKIKKLYQIAYKKYPNLIETLLERPKNYNSLKDKINALEETKKIIVIQPQKNVDVERLERDKEKLQNLYNQGRKITLEKLEEIKQYLSE